jgi:hypothetical protein
MTGRDRLGSGGQAAVGVGEFGQAVAQGEEGVGGRG